MAMVATFRRRWAGAGLVGIAAAGTGALFVGLTAARADMIMLRGGGQLQGKVLPDSAHPDRVQVLLISGRKPLSFQKAQILEIIPKASPLDDYLVKRAKAAQTAQAQFELATWCEKSKLADLARIHYEATVAIDRSFEQAQRKLGHIFHDGHWLSRDELAAVQGLIKHKGRWVSPEEKAKFDKEDEMTASRATWLRTVKLLRQSLVNGPADRKREAETQLMAIRDPDAVGALMRVFANDEPERRILLAHVLATIAGKEATAALVKLILAEPTTDVRTAIYEKLKDRDDPAVVSGLAKALGSSDFKIINRAAWVLGNLNAVETVPRLIPVLVTTEQELVLATPAQMNQVNGSNLPSLPGAPLAVSRNGSAVVYQSPPVVGGGAVAYGATSVPYGLPGGVGVSIGGGGVQNDNRADVRVATYTYRNVEVLAALEKMTGKEFGYDIGEWHRWVSHEFNPAPKPARRVPQP
jgi:hypothetical protein